MTDLPWHDPAFQADAEAWIHGSLADAGLRQRGPIERPHVFWWSTAWRIPTDAGVLWFKGTQPEGAFEARLTPLLAASWPDRTVEVVATDPGRGWALTRDAGIKLRELDDGRVVEHWEALLPRYAEIQVAFAGRIDQLLAMGVPDLRLATLPGQLAALVEEPELLMLGQEGGVGEDQRGRLREGLARFAAECERLASAGIPETLQHDDLNDGNAFLRGEDHVVFDWGDACIAHPFHSLVVALRSLAYRNGWAPNGSEVTRLLDAYLEPWSRHGSRAVLRDAASVARRTGTVQRSLAWRRSVLGMPAALRDEYVDSVPYGLRLYLLDGPWGSWDDGTF
ncbi:MAG TPA: aminoglycoside phosphotransferase family protein [Candidatus Limnocylindria bacterium]